MENNFNNEWYGVFDGSGICWLYDNPENAKKFGNDGPTMMSRAGWTIKMPGMALGNGVKKVSLNRDMLTDKKTLLLKAIPFLSNMSEKRVKQAIAKQLEGEFGLDELPLSALVAVAKENGFKSLYVGPNQKLAEYLSKYGIYGYELNTTGSIGSVVCYWYPSVVSNPENVRTKRVVSEQVLREMIENSIRKYIK